MSLGFAEIGQGYCIQNTTPEDVGGFQKIAILAYSWRWFVKLVARWISCGQNWSQHFDGRGI